ncbi:MAG TPA: lycopene cyclase domain-containing protein [Cyclobacteriaceae bacterium]|nr:lycopene cyclase domain-containing protein [Cyclobacteriaceae bacterium]MCB9238682.1 lycopene cyclase domain-containing protein [Flammeovirgaceae bacterium]MCB0500407.1 lycopene cyclase domain-containing protein [Cyclobacteriaceae bacterium]MCO5271840.1 lycopene cyclase domain-containing protein [Cyclobacteriaceae bacterium]MCW5901158.1 lycopene cyclase domain-containing protein [Cyclobacteriaceae bacterium]
MAPKYLYLAIDLAAISLPLLFSFHPKANFSKKWKYLWPAILVPGIFFLAWDEWFVRMGVWGFNPVYLTGIHVLSLPIEEVLFFICIPYACVFTYEAVGHFSKKQSLEKATHKATHILLLLFLAIGLSSFHLSYTFATGILSFLFLAYLHFYLKPSYLGRFYLTYLFILVPFFAINGVLTGTGIEGQVVWYDNSENLGIRIGTIPVEDIFYGMLLILMNVTVFEWLQARAAKH